MQLLRFIMLISTVCQRTNFRCAFKQFLPQSSSKRVFHETSGTTFRIIIAYQGSIFASFEDIWQIRLCQNVETRYVDHDKLRSILLQMPNTYHSSRFYKSRIPLFPRSTDSLKNPPSVTPSSFIFLIKTFSSCHLFYF